MTPEELTTEYLRREREANAPGGKGADVKTIIEGIMSEYGLTRQQVVQAVLDHTNMMGG